jgi:hypothetical protein
MITGKKIICGFIFFFIILFSLSFILAVNGCCFDSSSGFCTMNADQNLCNAKNGTYFSSPICAVSQCDLGCCNLGSSNQFVTTRTCQLLSQFYGFSYPNNFQMTTNQACFAAGLGNQSGACVYRTGYDNICTYTTAGNCVYDFYPGVLCSNPILNANCTQINQTMCVGNDVYYLDSCGNQDVKKETCASNAGMMCAHSGRDYVCVNMSCVDSKGIFRNNGESWCVPLHTGPLFAPVGSRAFKQYCINGQIITEPCADFRAETCEETIDNNSTIGNITKSDCKINPWQLCLAAGNDSSSCDPEYCKMSDNIANCRATGGNFYCGFGGDIFRTSADGSVRYEQVTEADVVGSINANGGTAFSSYGTCGTFDPDWGIQTCVPLIAGGLEFYPSQTTSSSNSGSSSFFSGSSGLGSGLSNTGVNQQSSSSMSSSTTLGVSDAKQVCSQGDFSGNAQYYRKIEISFGINNLHKTINLIKAIIAGGVCLYFTVNPVIALECTAIASGSYDKEKGCIGDGCKYFDTCSWNTQGQVLPAPGFIETLDERCMSLGDCGAKINWKVVPSGAFGDGTPTLDIQKSSKRNFINPISWTCGLTSCKVKTTIYYDYKISYKCEPWTAPEDGYDCTECGKDGMPCSEYRCKALGDKCMYYEPDAAAGYCIASSDITGPQITCTSPSGCPNNIPDVKPYTPIDIMITTDEISECKFDINSAGTAYNQMQYDFGTGGFGYNHTLRLTLPGQTIALNYSDDENLTSYPIITGDGNYTLYVKCIDVAGNVNLGSAYPIYFNVMKAPDSFILDPSNFNPASGSFIKFNTTEKTVSFKMLEPAECRWNLNDTNFDLMENDFSCDAYPSVNGIVNGYSCSGLLTNITLAIGSQTDFYIKCKDQPWIFNESVLINGVNYSRNTMQQSLIYTLKPSQKLLINSLTPSGNLKMPALNASLELRAASADGANSGIATCYWKVINLNSSGNSSYTPFLSTNATLHKQPISNPYLMIGANYYEVKCEDLAENEEITNVTFNLDIDRQTPIMNRLFSKSGSLVINTDEDAACYYSFDGGLGCFFDIANASIMNGFNKIHQTGWNYDKTYYIKCKDYYGNYDSTNCNGIIRVY